MCTAYSIPTSLRSNPYWLFILQWDTAGDPRFTKIAEAYYKSAHGFIVAFSTTDKVWLNFTLALINLDSCFYYTLTIVTWCCNVLHNRHYNILHCNCVQWDVWLPKWYTLLSKHSNALQCITLQLCVYWYAWLPKKYTLLSKHSNAKSMFCHSRATEYSDIA